MRKLSIYYKLIVSVLLVSLLPTIALGALAYYKISEVIHDNSLRLLRLIAVETAYTVERTLTLRLTEVRAWARLPDFVEATQERADPRRMTTVLNQLVSSYPMYDLLMIADARRRILAVNDLDRRGDGLPTASLLGSQLSDGPWFSEARRQGLFVSDFRQSSLLAHVYERRGESLSVSAPVLDEGGRVRGYVLAYLNWAYVQDILDTVQAAYGGELAATLFMTELARGRIIAHPNAEMYGEAQPLSAEQVQSLDRAPTGLFKLDWPERRTVGYALVRGAEELAPLRWLVCVEAPDEAIYRQAAFLRLMFILLSVAGTVMIALLVYLISQRFTEPIVQLAQAAQAIGAGHMNVEMPVSGADEVGALAGAFNQMSAALRLRDEELRAANRQLAEANLLKSQFLANVSHELRTPMNSIIGFTTLVIQRAGHLVPELQRRNLLRVRNNALNLLRLLNSILDLSKIEAGSMDVGVEKFSLRHLLDGCLQTIAPLLEGRPIELKMEAPPDDLVMFTDRHKVQQIVINLLGNAAKFTERGRIVVGFALRAHPGWTEPPPSGGPWARIWVADSGIGIAEDDLDEIFAEFRQVDGSPSRRYGGAGLGLAISKKLANLLEGDILVESKLGVGSTFAVVIPVRHPSTQPLMRGETRHEMPAAKPGDESSATEPATPTGRENGTDEETNTDR